MPEYKSLRNRTESMTALPGAPGRRLTDGPSPKGGVIVGWVMGQWAWKQNPKAALFCVFCFLLFYNIKRIKSKTENNKILHKDFELDKAYPPKIAHLWRFFYRWGGSTV
jgi:hypothetical protein